MAEITREQTAAFADAICSTAIMNVTLRDFFAAFALAGLIANQGSPRILGGPWLAAEAYHAADAMLAQRATKEK